MVINGTNLKNDILQNNMAAEANSHSVTAKSVLQSAFGAQFETTRDSYVHRGFAMCGIEDITYSKEDNKNKSTLSEAETSVMDNIKEMTEQLNMIVNQIDGLGYNEVRELFGISDDSDVKGIVTVVEQIQIKLAAALGEDYKGGVSFNAAEAEAVTGSTLTAASAVADNLGTYNLPVTKENEEQIYEALETLEKVKSITKEHAQYLVKNDLEPTIANVYKAQSSAGSVYDGIRLTDADWEQLKPQVTEIINYTFGENADNQEYLMQTARWMVEHDIELNSENLAKFVAIESIDAENISVDTAVRWITQAIAMGKPADAANLTPVEYTGAYVEDIVKRRQLEEIRLLMTKEAGLMLMKKGIDLDTTDLEKLVEELKAQEAEYFKSLGKLVDAELSDDDISIYKETVSAVELLKAGPAYIIGGAVKGDFETTIAESAEASKNMLSSMADKAEAAYEALMTRPEREYGDSISKAFRNIDALLEDIGLEDTAENNRAVRILAYNEMEITAENVEAVKAEDNEYQYLLKNMTPRMVLHLISEGINPLDMDIHELNDKLEDMKDEVGETKDEKFSEFLWRLDKSGQISEEEREAYLGIYRLLNTINRTDGAAIGALVNQGAEVTLNNLLTAARSRKHKGMDVKLDEDLSFVTKTASDNSITEQLKVFYDDSWKAEYEEYKKEEYKALASDEEALRLIAEEGQEPTINMIKAAGLLAVQNGTFFEKYLKLPKTSEEADKRKESLNKLTEALGDREALTEGYESVESTVSKMLEGYTEESAVSYDTLEDLRILAAGFKFLTASAKNNESYQVPLEISGNMTNVHLKIVRGAGESGLVKIEFNDETYGKVRAEFKVKGNTLEGFIISDSRSGIDGLKALEEGFAERIGGYDISLKRMDYAVSFFTQNTTGLSQTAEAVAAEDKVATKVLYGVAREFLLQLN